LDISVEACVIDARPVPMDGRMFRSAFFMILISCCLGNDATAADPERVVDFARQVLPLFADRCFACHGPDEKTREADLRLDLRASVFDRDAESPLIQPGKSSNSLLFERISSHDPDVQMPPPSATRQLSPTEIDLIRQWIDQGADWQEHWAFIPPVRPTVPKVSNLDWPRNGIDQFVLARLDGESLTPSNGAEGETLIRRVTLALTGLPPTPEEIDRFLEDQSPDSYEKLVDRLLASHRYGEHMAMPWLDAARYADTDGYQNDRIRYMWAWRDWLIQALNDGKPFDEFTIEQLAGDMLPNATLRQQIATGFCRNHRINSEGGSIPDEWIVEYVVDRVDTLGTVWMGLTLGCARCHDHKYDPVSQRGYYRLFAYFNNVAEWGLGPNNGNSPPFIKVPDDWPRLNRTKDVKIEPTPFELVTSQVSVVRPKPGGQETVMVMAELPEPRPTWLLQRGQYNLPDKSEALTPGLPSSLNTSDATPQDRRELAEWLVSPDNPLTARVIVNRHWQHFFGTGLVKTSENFGVQGEPPSHPELLDWLALEFLRSGWDVKKLHRLIVTAATYRQSSVVSRKQAERDPENRLLARGPRFRFSAHMIRDQTLAVSGLLREQIGGPSVKPYAPPGIWQSISNNKYVQDHGPSLYRRSLYTYWRRTVPPPTMATFNAAEREVCLVRKDRTNTPLQALTLMNNVAFVEAARFLAERILREADSNSASQIRQGFRIVTGRLPRRSESEPLKKAYEQFLNYFESNPTEAPKLLAIGEAPRDKKLPATQHAALAMLSNLLLNLDEAITLE
jgi:mono/diheme cytochrome c family protein